MRLLVTFLILAVLVLIPFAIWGEGLEAYFSQEGIIHWLEQLDHWAWLIGIGLLMADWRGRSMVENHPYAILFFFRNIAAFIFPYPPLILPHTSILTYARYHF